MPTINLSCNVEPDEVYYLSVVVGDGQVGHSSFRNFDGTFPAGNLQWIRLGKGDQIKGKTIYLSTTISDTNPFTNRTSVSILINNRMIHPTVIEHTLDDDYSSIVYLFPINFI